MAFLRFSTFFFFSVFFMLIENISAQCTKQNIELPVINLAVNAANIPVQALNTHINNLWVEHKLQYNVPNERYTIFAKRVSEIIAHNALPNKSYSLGINFLTHWTNEEIANLTPLDRIPPPSEVFSKFRTPQVCTSLKKPSVLFSTVDLPPGPCINSRLQESITALNTAFSLNINSNITVRGLDNTVITPFDWPWGPWNKKVVRDMDWRNHNGRSYLTPIKAQGCGDCWDFASVGEIEAQFNRYYDVSYPVGYTGVAGATFSEQRILDCITGCGGNWDQNAFQFVINNGGLQSSSEYGGSASAEQFCRTEKDNEQALYVQLTGQGSLKAISVGGTPDYLDVVDIMGFVDSIGPQAIYYRVDNDFGSYSSGIYNNPCTTEGINHAMVIVGYHYEATKSLFGAETPDFTKSYWIVRNSWGNGWGGDGGIVGGEKGYIKVAMGSNLCDIEELIMWVDIKPNGNSDTSKDPCGQHANDPTKWYQCYTQICNNPGASSSGYCTKYKSKFCSNSAIQNEFKTNCPATCTQKNIDCGITCGADCSKQCVVDYNDCKQNPCDDCIGDLPANLCNKLKKKGPHWCCGTISECQKSCKIPCKDCNQLTKDCDYCTSLTTFYNTTCNTVKPKFPFFEVAQLVYPFSEL
jgi:hypothetical protein